VVLLEAMAAGVPSWRAASGHPEILQDGVTGLLFDPFSPTT